MLDILWLLLIMKWCNTLFRTLSFAHFGRNIIIATPSILDFDRRTFPKSTVAYLKYNKKNSFNAWLYEKLQSCFLRKSSVKLKFLSVYIFRSQNWLTSPTFHNEYLRDVHYFILIRFYFYILTALSPLFFRLTINSHLYQQVCSLISLVLHSANITIYLIIEATERCENILKLWAWRYQSVDLLLSFCTRNRIDDMKTWVKI